MASHFNSPRRRVDELTSEEVCRELLTDPLTGLGNRRAYEETTRRPVLIWVDVRNLYEINQQYGRDYGDEALLRVACTLDAHSSRAYRLFADKFMLEADTMEEAKRIVDRCWLDLFLEQIPVTTKDGQRRIHRSILCWWGIGCALREAEWMASAAKKHGSLK